MNYMERECGLNARLPLCEERSWNELQLIKNLRILKRKEDR